MIDVWNLTNENYEHSYNRPEVNNIYRTYRYNRSADKSKYFFNKFIFHFFLNTV